ncbi:MAG TPA: hypothetical protein VF221_15855 [Chloroflexota bacterium]
MTQMSSWDGTERRSGEDRRHGLDRRTASRTVWERRSGYDRRGHKLYSPRVDVKSDSDTEPEELRDTG